MPSLDRDADVFVLDLGDGENRFNPTSCAEIAALLDEVDAAPAPKALVTTATGKCFSNGLDLAWADGDVDKVIQCADALAPILGRVALNDAPTVAAIQGHAFAGGALLALAHDHRVMRADRGYFCLPEVDLGMVFNEGHATIGRAKLTPEAIREAMLFGHRFGGGDAFTLKLVDLAVAADDVLPRAMAIAAGLAPKAGRTLGGIKRRMYPEVRRTLLP